MSTDLILTPPETRAITPIELINKVIGSGGDPVQMAQVIKELAALQQSQERFAWEREERQSKIDFDDALNQCQAQIGRIAPNQKRENNIGWADYAQLDRIVRPLYIASGFSIGFSEVESSDPERLRMCATVSRGGISRQYFADISRKPGNAKMNQTDADASAASRVKRYLLLDIFNIAIGIDKDEKQGIPVQEVTERELATLADWEDSLRRAPDLAQLKNVFGDAYKYAKSVGDKQKNAMSNVYEQCKRRFA